MDPIKDFLEIVKIAKAHTHRNLTLFPLLAPESGDPDYLTLMLQKPRRRQIRGVQGEAV